MIRTAIRRAAPLRSNVVAQRQLHVNAQTARGAAALCRIPGQSLLLQQQHQLQQRATALASARWSVGGARMLSGSLSDNELRSRTNDFQDDFAEARMCLGDANDSLETVYFEEDLQDAQDAVKACLASYEALINDLSPEQAGAFKRENGLKVEQLKGELDALMQSLLEE
ncbi:Hypothetical Protein FCC1311_104492 [Hondaea fermentalgiana]|uniref:Uncharacterized protein n=1 Tax=Hondaea fermentalgiana TaxID=2315210 RepID=A0A2R5GUI4_9STRA|nr:Hypothetical Protein FCC1311_104492 [Hondaea fermentalgiana]|eukprot:GBG34225.1 Hypothetical Protein FCC1311_104492 [Hondaea fermentalgiana]